MSAAVLINPTTSASPQSGGTCTPAAVGSPAPFPTYQYSAYQDYKFMARPNAGYQFVRFDITQTTDYGDGSAPTVTHFSKSGTYSVADAAWTWQTDCVGDWNGIYWWDYTPQGYSEIIQVTAYEVVAVFKRIPTHLLVNSSTAENPAKLVYDPITNLLVADY